MSSGGSKQPKDTTVTQSTIPKFAEPYAMEMLGNASALTNPLSGSGKYNSYIGPNSGRTVNDMVAGNTALQNQAYGNIGGMQVAPELGQASNMAGLAGLNAGNLSQYDPTIFQQHQMGPAQQVGSQNWTDSGVASSYMSPYIQNVIQAQQRDANRQADIAGTKRGFQTATSGAYGGSRASLGDFEANRNLALQQGDIMANGMQNAYTTGASLFNQDQGRGLQAGIANQNAGIAVGQTNLQALLENQRMGEQSRQYGSDLGLRGLGMQLDSGRLLNDVGNSAYNQQTGINGQQLQAGNEQQQLEQRRLDVPYQEFLNQLNFPYKNLGFMSNMLHGLPTDQSSTVYGYPNTTGQAIGNLGGIASLYAAGKGG